MRIGLCTGGGDCPGLNAVIRAVVKHSKRSYNMSVIGIANCLNGLLLKPYNVKDLVIDDVSDILLRGGTILGTHNRGDPLQGDKGKNNLSLIKHAIKDLDLDGVIIIGGEGTQALSCNLITAGIPVVGVPKTIDNDLPGTEQTIGFSSCVDLVANSVSCLQSTAESHDRIMILEVMGRDSGYIALHGGVAGGAHIILIPEIPVSIPALVAKVKERKRLGRHHVVVVVSEGVTLEGQKQLYTVNSSNKRLGGIGQHVADKMRIATGIETRVTVLGHLQRGGSPNSQDRLLATMMGVKAVDLCAQGQFNRLVVTKEGKVQDISFNHEQKWQRRKIKNDDQLLSAAESIGVCFGRGK